MSHTVIGVMGPAQASLAQIDLAYALGHALATADWVVLTGGRDAGVMAAACRGAKAAGGLTVGVLPGADAGGAAAAVDIAIVTGLGDARNAVNVLSSRVVVACGLGPGTASEIALALKAQRPVLLMAMPTAASDLWIGMAQGPVATAATADAAVGQIRRWLGETPPHDP